MLATPRADDPIVGREVLARPRDVPKSLDLAVCIAFVRKRTANIHQFFSESCRPKQMRQLLRQLVSLAPACSVSDAQCVDCRRLYQTFNNSWSTANTAPRIPATQNTIEQSNQTLLVRAVRVGLHQHDILSCVGALGPLFMCGEEARTPS